MAEKAPENMSFEAALERLEGIVRKLEAGELTLDDSLAAFEEGVRLSTFCHKRLDDVEKKVQLLLSDGRTAPFDAEAESKRDSSGAHPVARTPSPEADRGKSG